MANDVINKLIDDLSHGKLTRRDFIKRAAILGLSLSSISAILAACGGTAATPEATETAAATDTAAATETAAGGTVISGEPIKIGGIFNLTGGMSSIDVPSANGAKLAAKEINAADGILGRQIDLIVMDSKTDVTTCSNVATQLVEVDKVIGIVGVNDTNYALPIGQVAQNAKIPFITPGSTAPIIPTNVGDYAFLGCFGDNVQAAAAAEFAYENLGKSCWLLYDKGADYTTGLARYFKVRWEELGGTISSEDIYQTGDTDYSSQITKLKSLNPQPEFVFVSSGPDEIGTIVKQVREAGITLPMMGGDGWDTPLLVELPGATNATNLWFTTHLGLADNSPKATAFKEAYKAEYGKDLDSVFGALGYDSIYLFKQGIENADTADDPTKIRDGIAAIKDFEGVTGKLSYPEGERVPQKAIAIVKVVDGVISFDQEWIPEVIPAP